MCETPLDRLHIAMIKTADERSRRRYFSEFLATDIVLALEKPADQTLSPKTLVVGADTLALAFDTEKRLAGFGQTHHYAVMAGRDLVELLKDSGLGLGLNLAGEGHALHLAPSHIQWLSQQNADPANVEEKITVIGPPGDVSGKLLDVLHRRLTSLAALAEAGFLVTTEQESGEGQLLLLLCGVPLQMRAQFAGHIAEALALENVDVALDVGFAEPGDPLLMAAARHGLQIEMPSPIKPTIAAPGSDPDKPPKLH